MSTTSDWEILAIQCDPQTSEQLDYVRGAPGPHMRKWLGDVFFSAKEGALGRPRVLLAITYRPSGNTRATRIIKDNRHFRASHRGNLITLEASVKIMKEEITTWLRGIKKSRPSTSRKRMA